MMSYFNDDVIIKHNLSTVFVFLQKRVGKKKLAKILCNNFAFLTSLCYQDIFVAF